MLYFDIKKPYPVQKNLNLSIICGFNDSIVTIKLEKWW
jgi:hypothetical protein